MRIDNGCYQPYYFWWNFIWTCCFFRIYVLNNLIYIFYFCGRNVKSSCWRTYAVFDVYNTTVILIFVNDIFYSLCGF